MAATYRRSIWRRLLNGPVRVLRCVGLGLRRTTGWTRIDQFKMLRNWARAEATSPQREMSEVIGGWPAETQRKLYAGQHEALSEAEWRMLEAGIVLTRQPLLVGLLWLQPQWYQRDVPVEMLADMRIINFSPFVQKASSRKLADLAEAERGGATAGKSEFSLDKMVGLPIAVGLSFDGPFCLVEGYTRCCTILRDYKDGTFQHRQVPFIVGVSERIVEWSWWW